MTLDIHPASLWEAIADALGGRHDAIVQGDRRVSWAAFEDRAARVAGALEAVGLGADSKVGLFLHNCPEYLETYFGALKIRAIPFNVNFRYTADEVAYLLADAGAEALVYHTSLGPVVAEALEATPALKLLVAVDDGEPQHTDAVAYEVALAAATPAARIERRSSDVTLVYTGGTTGMPKGVIHPVAGTVSTALADLPLLLGEETVENQAEAVFAAVRLAAAGRATASVVAPPLIHNTALSLGAIPALSLGGTVVLLPSRRFDPDEVWAVAACERAVGLIVVGDAFARPLLRSLDSHAPRGLGDLRIIASSGAMFSSEVKSDLLARLPRAVVLDFIAATEGVMGMSIAAHGDPGSTARFTPAPGVIVIRDDESEVTPGSGEVGQVAVPAATLGYFNDENKTASTYRVINGRRYTIPGDAATIEADGSIALLGRGSSCINTGGEKVFPEEVEEVLKTSPAVEDALVVGIDDERFGQAVAAVIARRPGRDEPVDEILAHARTRLAGYKVPRTVLVVDEVPRTDVGKPDYPTAREMLNADASVTTTR